MSLVNKTLYYIINILNCFLILKTDLLFMIKVLRCPGALACLFIFY